MNVDKLYVRVSLHQESRLSYGIDKALLQADIQGDPNQLLNVRASFLEARIKEAMTPEEALQKYPRCVVLGDPGAGKSTLLKYLTLQAVDRQLPKMPDLPIYIVLGEFAASASSDLLSFAAQRWDEEYGFPEDEARSYIEGRLSDGDALLLLDALDETVIGSTDTAARDSYSRVTVAINQLAKRYHNVPIVVTARRAGYTQRSHISGFTELELLDFRPPEIEKFVENWFCNHPTPPTYATAPDLNIQLRQNTRMRSLAANPLLLCLIVLVYESLQDLPEQRAEIYKQCVDVLLSKWDTSRDIRRRKKFKPEHKQLLLTEIAWHFHVQGRRYFPEEELLTVIASFLPSIGRSAEESQAVLREIEEENGLLKEQAHGWHGFLHLTLQEYFVALYLSQIKNGQKILLKHCGDPWWKEITLLYAGSIRDAGPLLQGLMRKIEWRWPWDREFTPLIWAGQCLTMKPRVGQRKMRDKVVARLSQRFVKQAMSYYRVSTISIGEVLLSVEGNDARGKHLALLKDPHENKDVRGSIAYALGALGERAVVPELLALLKDPHENKDVRGSIAYALGALGEQAMVPELLALLKDPHENKDVRGSIAYALGALGEQAMVPELLALLKDPHEDTDVRRSITEVLGSLGERAVVPELLAMLKEPHEDTDVRRSITYALRALGERAVVPELLALLKDPHENKDVRGSIAYALRALGERAVVPELLALLKDHHVKGDLRRAIKSAQAEISAR
jgi:GTPase SAR1 family protein